MATDEYLLKKAAVSLQDLAYDKYYGRQIYKLYKKYAREHLKSSPVDLFDYAMIRKCKECSYETQSVVYMLNHIRSDNLPQQC